MNQHPVTIISILIKEFLKKEGCCETDPCAPSEFDLFENKKLPDAIKMAALATFNGKRFKHQRRLKSAVLKKSKQKLLRCIRSIKKCDDFDSLHELIEEKLGKIKGAGILYKYDTAFRIGISMGKKFLPDKVYLHAGTLEGAKKLRMETRKKKYLEMDEFKNIDLKNLKAYQVEDFLCRFKDKLSPPA